MANKMLVDAAHPEETRVVVLRGNRVEEFDFESASRKQLRGNIYLAKVTRVEPSLQAAFVDYGGNRHGFLAFSEIHPDYYQIPVADRQALIEAEEREIAEADDRADEAAEASEARGETAVAAARSDDPDAVVGEVPQEEHEEDNNPPRETDGDAERASEARVESADHEAPAEREADRRGEESGSEDGAQASGLEVVSDDRVESVGAEDALEELPERRKGRPRQYKIQEVIKRRQVLLVQVVKEERGTKGAALTTYLSLAGRYSVLMPNTARGGGISRKITSPADRKRLKEVASELDVPEGMGIILRTAGASRTKAEVKRDFEYLLRLWENVRELTLQSTAPTLVYEEGSLIKRSIRDLYNKDIDEIQVAGDDAYREAKDFMRMLMPSHAKNVQPYRDKQPIFQKNGIEAQLDAMFSPQVTLRSGGYLVINQTEALVSIDVNSGRATREHNIEDTAYQTNLEASEEVARQLRLRDLAGLIVIDFIDMEEKRNNRSVERKLKDALKHDRARIQVGRISHFGLLEMSRQRIRTGVLESTTTLCPVCQGTGHIRAPASVALHVLRSIEDSLLRGVTHNLIVHARTAVALYILNQKRPHLSELEQRFGLTITVMADESISNGSHFSIERGEAVERREVLPTSVQPDSVQPVVEEEEEPFVEAEAEDELPARETPESRDSDDRGEEAGGRRRRRRRRRRGGEGFAQPEAVAARDDAEEGAEGSEADEAAPEEPHELAASGENDGDPNRKRRRGRRGGRRGRRGRGEERGSERVPAGNGGEPSTAPGAGDAPAYAEPYRVTNGGSEQDYTSSPSMQASSGGEPDRSNEESGGYPVAVPTAPDLESPAEHRPEPREYPPVAVPLTPDAPSPHEHQSAENVEATMRRPEPKEIVREEAAPAEEPRPPQPEDPSRPKRSGWWQRRTFF